MSKKNNVINVVLAFFVTIVIFFLGVWFGYAFFSNKDSQTIIREYGYLERLAYESSVKYCNARYDKARCDQLMIQTAIPYDEEFGAGIHFIFSNSRKTIPGNDTITISVDMLATGIAKSVKEEDSAVLDNALLP